MNFFFLAALFISVSFSSLADSFEDEKKKIMAAYNKENAFERCFNKRGVVWGFKDHFDSILGLDSILFWKKMRKEKDKIFLFTFWSTFKSDVLFLCRNKYNKKHRKEFKDLLAQISYSNWNNCCATTMLFHI
jgi:hypothetical protein